MGAGAPTPVVIQARGLGKCFRIYDSPTARLKEALFRRSGRSYSREFWAARDVTVSVERGSALGIIGKNGSGKSTLLQMIAGTLVPTTGEVEIRGRVAALLELGSGFNPEFTGRENVYLNGAILGISRKEMHARFDDIAAFADIGNYIDQPVRTYSSGMYARLAFSVAIAVDPDILIVDEILSVGDLGFQQKCLQRLRELRDRGLTLLYVSHSPDAIKSVCDRALFMKDGAAVSYGPADVVMDEYLAYIKEEANRDALLTEGALGGPVQRRTSVEGQLRYGSGHVQIVGAQLLDVSGGAIRAIRFGERVTLVADLLSTIDAKDLSLSFIVRDQTGVDLFGTTSFDEGVKLPPLPKEQRIRVHCTFENTLRQGNFGICLAVHRVSQPDYSDNVLFDQIDGALAFTVIGDPQRPVHYKYHHPVELSYEVIS